jgi:hypothetical protein
MTQAELQDIKLKELASEYRMKGYTVFIRPDREELPAFLSQFHPDLLAVSDKDNVVVVIKSTADLPSDRSLVPLAAAIEAQPQWRFRLAIVNLPTEPELPENGELVPDERIDALLREARELNAEGRNETAAMIAWAAAEAVLRRVAHDNGADVYGKYSGSVIKQLYVMGLLEDDEYYDFMRAVEFRDAFAHGFAATAQPDIVARLLQDVEAVRFRVVA